MRHIDAGLADQFDLGIVQENAMRRHQIAVQQAHFVEQLRGPLAFARGHAFDLHRRLGEMCMHLAPVLRRNVGDDAQEIARTRIGRVRRVKTANAPFRFAVPGSDHILALGKRRFAHLAIMRPGAVGKSGRVRVVNAPADEAA